MAHDNEYVHGVWRLIDSSDARHILVLVRVDGLDDWLLTHCTVKPNSSTIIPIVDLVLPAVDEARIIDYVEAYLDKVFDQQSGGLLLVPPGKLLSVVVKQYFEVKSGDSDVVAKKIEFIESFPFAPVIGSGA